MRKKNTETIGEVLAEFFEENKLLRLKLAENRIVSGWAKLLGPAVATYTTNIYIRHGVLYVHLSSSVLRSQLMMSKEKLIDSLNTYAKINIIEDIKFR